MYKVELEECTEQGIQEKEKVEVKYSNVHQELDASLVASRAISNPFVMFYVIVSLPLPSCPSLNPAYYQKHKQKGRVTVTHCHCRKPYYHYHPLHL